MASAVTLHQMTPPSRDELANDIRQHLPSLWLFRDAQNWLVMEIFGRQFAMPPNLPGEPLIDHLLWRDQNTLEPVKVKANGRLACRDIYGIHRDPRTQRPLKVGLLEGQDSGAIVIYAVENYGDQGVVWLRGDETDKGRMDKSRKLYNRYVRGWAEGERASRAEFVAKFLALPANKGRIPPPPSANQIRAQEILDGQSISERAGAFICVIAYDWEGDSFEKYAQHMKAAHNKIVQPPKDETTQNPGRAAVVSDAEIERLSGESSDGEAQLVGEPIIPEQGRRATPNLGESPKEQRRKR